MYSLNLKKMCKNTASEKIHIWFPNKANGDTQIKSIETEDIELVLAAY